MNPIERTHSVISRFTRYISFIALAVTFVLMIVTTVDVILRAIAKGMGGGIKLGIDGSYDMTEMGMVIIVFFGIAYFQSQRGHVRVEMFVEKFPYKVRCLIEGVVYLVEGGFGALMCYSSFSQIARLQSRGVSTATIHIPHWPLAVFMTIGLLLFTIFLFLDAILAFMKIGQKPKPAGSEEK